MAQFHSGLFGGQTVKTKLDIEKIAKGLGAVRGGTVEAPPGYFGALQLVSQVESRFRTPTRGGRRKELKLKLPFLDRP